MFVHPLFVYPQMHKTACTHITRVLQATVGGVQRRKHARLRTDPDPRLAVLGSVRNPWDWYVSLWAFGCSGRGLLYNSLTAPALSPVRLRSFAQHVASAGIERMQFRMPPPRDRRYWLRLYSDVNDVRLFREWLNSLFRYPTASHVVEGFGGSPLAGFAGFMSYRFLRLYSRPSKWREEHRAITSPEQLGGYWKRNALTGSFVRMEDLEADLSEFLSSLGYSFSPGELGKFGKTNTNVHRDYRYYYDDQAVQLVEDRDRLIVGEFSYSF